jgi:hypothetical protein
MHFLLKLLWTCIWNPAHTWQALQVAVSPGQLVCLLSSGTACAQLDV